jgi:hypothetical protein
VNSLFRVLQKLLCMLLRVIIGLERALLGRLALSAVSFPTCIIHLLDAGMF